MNIGDKRQLKITFPLGLYLKQLFNSDTYVRYINPWSFWHRYKIDRLETCLELNTVQYLESCYKLNYQAARHIDIGFDLSHIHTSLDSLFKQSQLNTIYVSQPRIKLKYRGVTYYTNDIFYIDINFVEVDPKLVNFNSLQCDLFANNHSPKESNSNQ